MITYHVHGTPAPQGSKIRTRYGMIDASKKLKPWREAVHQASEAIAATVDMVAGPFRVYLDFTFTRPAKPAREYPPIDLDKLCRSTLDGMTTGRIIADDKHCTSLIAKKSYGERSGVRIRIEPL